MSINYIDSLIERNPELLSQKQAIIQAVECLKQCYQKGGKVLICGNGGSSADCEHISGELLKGFISPRPLCQEKIQQISKYLPVSEVETLQEGIPAIPLTSLVSALTAFSNDVGYDTSFAQLVYALGKRNDLIFAISTSGNSKSVLKAVAVGKALGIKVVALTGKTGGELVKLADVNIVAPADQTHIVQEYHLPIYHAICAQVESELFG